MATTVDLITIAQNQAFQSRVTYALYNTAIAVLSELGSTQGHTQRVVYAKAILNGNSNTVNVAIGVLTNTTIASEADISKSVNGDYGIPDGDIQFAVNTFFNAFSGVSS